MSTNPNPILQTRPKTSLSVLQPIRRSLGEGIIAEVVIEEDHEDKSIITRHPVEQGATISDHAYDEPAEVALTYGWSISGPQNMGGDSEFLFNIYQRLLQVKAQRVPFRIFTGKRVYHNMLIESIHVTTDKTTENFLYVKITCQEVIMATTQTVQLSDASVQALPSKTGPDQEQGTVNLQPGTNFNSGGPQ